MTDFPRAGWSYGSSFPVNRSRPAKCGSLWTVGGRKSAARHNQVPRPAFIPFGAGARQCLGEGFAWVEASVVLAVILRRWRVRPQAGPAIRKVAQATLVPSRLPLIVERR
jgi:cytochrome P450